MRLTLAFIILFTSIFSFSQDKLFTIKDAISGYHLYPRGLSQLQFLPESKMYSHVTTNDSGERELTIYNLETSKEEMVISLDDIKNSIGDGSAIKNLPFARWINSNEFQFYTKEVHYAYNIKTKNSRKLYKSDVNSGLNYAPKNDGYVRTTDRGFKGQMGNTRFLKEENAKGVVMGKAVHRYEFGITNGLFWSPDSRQLAYYYMNESMVTEYPLYKLADTPATATMLRYPTAGAQSHHVEVRIMDNKGKVVNIKTEGPKDQFLTNVSWTPDSKHVLIAIVNRAQNHMKLNMYDASTGDFIKTLIEESNEKYVEPEHPALFLENDPTKFIWWSERDGYNHLYLYNLEGEMLQQLTKGNWVVNQLHGFSASGDEFYITSTQESPTERHLYCVNTKSGKTKKLTQEAGYHRIVANSDCSMFIDDYSSTTIAKRTLILNNEGETVKDLHTSDNPLSEYKLADLELGVLKGAGGEDLHYRLFKPVDFDPNKKYPVVVYLYNGPHAQMVTNRWLGGANMWYHYMAQHGYAVFTIDGRGSAYRGFDFESAIFRNCGEKEMEDQLTGVEWLKSQKWVDADRLGIHGWSYGGFMTTSLMSRNPGIYKVGVAGGPVIDWSLYEIMYTERYMDTPEENPEGYKAANLKNYIGDLEGKLLMIHGGQDDVVLWQHSLQYLEEAIKKGVQLDYFVYPHHKHNVIGPDRVHLYDKVSNYFFDHL
jgi:dipeptidyl-peptidase-4